MMRSKTLVLVCGLLMLFAMSLFAQEPAPPDPITGTWTGELLPGDDNSRPVTFVLKFDGKTAVTGTFTGLQTPGDVKRGTFDTKTGALRLALGQQNEAGVLITLEGTVAKGTATGKMTGQKTGEFRLERKAAKKAEKNP